MLTRFLKTAAVLAALFAPSVSQAATYQIESTNLRGQNCSIPFTPGCYVGSLRFNYDTVTQKLSAISWEVGYNTSQGFRMESIVTADQDTLVGSLAGVTYTQVRVLAFTASAGNYDYVFYSNTPATVTVPGPNYFVEISGASSYVAGSILDIDPAAVIAGTDTSLSFVYQEPLGGNAAVGNYHGYGGTAQATLIPPAAVPLPATLPLLLLGAAGLAALRRRS